MILAVDQRAHPRHPLRLEARHQRLEQVAADAALAQVGIDLDGKHPAGRRLAEASLYARGMRAIGKLPGALIKGDGGSPVAALQKALKLGADGAFGSGTMIAVWNYQKTNAALADTGVAETGTLKALGVA